MLTLMNTALTLAEFYGTWKYYTLMVVLLIAVVIIFKVVRGKQA